MTGARGAKPNCDSTDGKSDKLVGLTGQGEWVDANFLCSEYDGGDDRAAHETDGGKGIIAVRDLGSSLG